jgi:hypothetical protein
MSDELDEAYNFLYSFLLFVFTFLLMSVRVLYFLLQTMCVCMRLSFSERIIALTGVMWPSSRLKDPSSSEPLDSSSTAMPSCYRRCLPR